jgi:hypothetical protein
MSFFIPIKENREQTLALFALIAISLPPQPPQRALLSANATGDFMPMDWSHKALTAVANLLELDSNEVIIHLQLSNFVILVFLSSFAT